MIGMKSNRFQEIFDRILGFMLVCWFSFGRKGESRMLAAHLWFFFSYPFSSSPPLCTDTNFSSFQKSMTEILIPWAENGWNLLIRKERQVSWRSPPICSLMFRSYSAKVQLRHRWLKWKSVWILVNWKIIGFSNELDLSCMVVGI